MAAPGESERAFAPAATPAHQLPAGATARPLARSRLPAQTAGGPAAGHCGRRSRTVDEQADPGGSTCMLQPSPRSPLATLDLPPHPPHRQDLVQPYLSSARAGWEGICAEATHEPREFEGWLRPVRPNISLTLFTGGPMFLEWRHLHAQRSWTGATLRHGDLILRPTHSVPYELRWRSLSSAPTHTFTLAMPQEALADTAQHVAGDDPTHPPLV